MTILVTGFGPFEDVDDNASGRVAERLHGRSIMGHEVVGVVLATEFASARARIAELVTRLAPSAVVALGVSGDAHVRLERRAAAKVTSQRPDVAGEVWAGRALGDAAELRAGDGFTWWLEAARAVDETVTRSDDAGGYVCNAVYHALLAAAGDAVPAVFVHIPRDLEDAALARRIEVVEAVLSAMV